jgi:ubiquinone/menaquinone biosynthesis C-methylase UbiE
MAALEGVREAYDATAAAWTTGPQEAYAALAAALLSHAPRRVAGARVLDLGAGTGVAARAARDAGAAAVVGVDLAHGMLRAGSGWHGAVCGDAAVLPFADGAFGLVVAACCLGHLPRPVDALAECRRVAGAVVASAFLGGWTHPAKALVDAAATRHGFEVPPWYATLKTQVEPAVDDVASLSALARAAGFEQVEVDVDEVDVGVRTPDALVRWRLGMAHLAPWVATLDPDEREQLSAECEQALVGAPALVVPQVALAAS